MEAVMTIFQSQQRSDLHQSDLPAGLQPVINGKSALDHAVNQLIALKVSIFYIITDVYQKEIEASEAYQRICQFCPCRILSVQKDFNKIQTLYRNEFLRNSPEDILWIRGDLVIPRNYLDDMIGDGNRSAFLAVFYDQKPNAVLPEVSLAEYMKGISLFPAEDLARTDALYISQQDRQKINRSITESDDLLNQITREIVISPVLVAQCTILDLAETGPDFQKSLLLINAMEKPLLLDAAEMRDIENEFQKTGDFFLFRDAYAEGELNALCNSIPATDYVDIDSDSEEAAKEKWRLLKKEDKTCIVCGGRPVVSFVSEMLETEKGEHQPEMLLLVTQDAFIDAMQIPDARVYIRTNMVSEVDNLELYVYIMGQTVDALYAADRSRQRSVLLNNMEEQYFSNEHVSDYSLLYTARNAFILNQLSGWTILSALSEGTKHILDCPVSFAKMLMGGALTAWLSKNLRSIYPYERRRAINDLLSEIMIVLNIESSEEILPAVYAAFQKAGYSIRNLSEGIHEIWKYIDQRAIENSAVDLSEEDFQSMICLLAEEWKRFDHSRLTGEDPDVLLQTGNRVSVRSAALRIREHLIQSRIKNIQAKLLKDVSSICNRHHLEFWIKKYDHHTEKDQYYDEYSYGILMKPEAIRTFKEIIFSELSDGVGCCFDITPFPNVFADIYIYRQNTRLENSWNFYVKEDVRKIGITIQRLFPDNPESMKYLSEYILLNRIISVRKGYEWPEDEFSPRLSEMRDWILSLPKLQARVNELELSAEQGSDSKESYVFVKDLKGSMMPVSLNNTGTANIGGQKIKSISVDIPLKSELHEAENTAICNYIVGLNDRTVYTLRIPAEKIDHSYGIGYFCSIPLKKVWRIVKAIGRLPVDLWRNRSEIKNEIRTNLKTQMRGQTVRARGMLRRAGICLSESERELKAYRNKYAGQRCFLIGNGPSLHVGDLNMLQEEITFGCNFIHKIYSQTDWRPTFHFLSDSGTVRTSCWDIVSHVDDRKTTMVIRDFTFRKMPYVPSKVLVAPSVSTENYHVSKDFLAYHYISHATVMSMMIEAAIYMGFDKIYLLGVEGTTSSDKGGNFVANYFTPKQREALNELKRKAIKNYDPKKRREELGDRQQMVYGKLAQYAEKRGVKIYNATRGGAVEVFERVDFDSVLTSP